MSTTTKTTGKCPIQFRVIVVFRYMAAMDLCAEVIKLHETSKIEEALERRICSAFIKHLKDTSPDVQSIAVKSIQQIAPILKDNNLIMIVESLASEVVDSGSNKDVRDIFSLAIKSTISELQDHAAAKMIKAVYPKLISGLRSTSADKSEIQEECLQILAEIFKNFAVLLQQNDKLVDKNQMNQMIFQLIQSAEKEVRKRATNCLGQLAVILNHKQLNELAQHLTNKLSEFTKNVASKEDLLTHV